MADDSSKIDKIPELPSGDAKLDAMLERHKINELVDAMNGLREWAEGVRQQANKKDGCDPTGPLCATCISSYYEMGAYKCDNVESPGRTIGRVLGVTPEWCPKK